MPHSDESAGHAHHELPADFLDMTHDELQEQVWGAVNDAGVVNNEETAVQNRPGSIYIQFIKCLLYFICVWQCLNFVSENALEKLLRVLATVFEHFGCGQAFMAGVAAIFPTSTYMVKQWLDTRKTNFKRFVVCPECTYIYDVKDILYKDRHGNMQAKRCQNERFPRGKFSKACGAQLMKRVVLSEGKIDFYPIKLYCYRPISESLETILSRKGVEENCNWWRKRKVPKDYYGDIYDGEVCGTSKHS